MISIEERAKINATFIGNQSPFDAYIEGAKEQQKIDIEHACNAIYDFIDLGCDIPNIEETKKYLTNAIKGETI